MQNRPTSNVELATYEKPMPCGPIVQRFGTTTSLKVSSQARAPRKPKTPLIGVTVTPGVSRGTIGPLAPDTLAVSVVEGWRGEVVHALETDREGRLIHYKVQDPSLRNWMGLAQAVRGEEISDFPICNKSFDLSYCGSDL